MSEEVRQWSEALPQAHERERTIVIEGGDPKGVREEILDLRRKLREGGRLKAGDLLAGRFQLIEALGKGGFATVWKAYDLDRRTLVAVKVLHGQYADDRTRLERFFRGVRKMAEGVGVRLVRSLLRRLSKQSLGAIERRVARAAASPAPSKRERHAPRIPHETAPVGRRLSAHAPRRAARSTPSVEIHGLLALRMPARPPALPGILEVAILPIVARNSEGDTTMWS